MSMKTQSKKILEEWEEVRLVDIASINLGQSPEGKFYNEKG